VSGMRTRLHPCLFFPLSIVLLPVCTLYDIVPFQHSFSHTHTFSLHMYSTVRKQAPLTSSPFLFLLMTDSDVLGAFDMYL
jgi:hypothetical protein